MGPIRSISGMIDDVKQQTGEIVGATDRLRNANRHLTGGDGRATTPLVPAEQAANSLKGEPPLMIQLTIAISALDAAMGDLRSEISYLEQHSETGEPRDTTAAAGAAKGW